MVICLISIHRTIKNAISQIIRVFIFTINKTAVDFQGVEFQTNKTTNQTKSTKPPKAEHNYYITTKTKEPPRLKSTKSTKCTKRTKRAKSTKRTTSTKSTKSTKPPKTQHNDYITAETKEPPK